MKGTVKWFSDSKGFGFIKSAEGQDIFFHHSVIRMEGYRSLSEGDKVEFEMEPSEKGPRAKNVRMNNG